jgi:uncharacterized protein (TIGR00369 family)
MKKKKGLGGAAQAGLRAYKHPDLFGELVGYEVVSVDKKKHEGMLRLRVQERHLSPARRVHGGVVAACFDVSLGVAVFSTMDPWDVCSTVELKVNYLHPIHLSDVLLFKSAVDFRGKRLCVAHSYVYKNGETKPTGMASGTYYVLSSLKTEPAEGPKRPKRGRAS